MRHRRDESTDPPLDGLPLFAPKPRALYSPDDPSTSREAAEKIAPRIGRAQAVALAFVTNYPGHTTKELGQIVGGRLGIDHEEMRQRIGRRLNELERADLIHRSGVRDGCSRWWPGKKTAGAAIPGQSQEER